MLIVCMTLCLMPTGAFALAEDGDVSIDSTNFPDARFRAYVKKLCDANNDDVLSKEKIKDIINIDCRNSEISDLKGSEYFTELQSLTCYGNKLTKLDVSNNRKLVYLSCYSNKLEQLNVRNTAIEKLYCYFNNLTELDISGNTNLTDLVCYSNNLRKLDTSKNTLLEQLYCDSNSLTELDLRKNVKLKYLSCNSN